MFIPIILASFIGFCVGVMVGFKIGTSPTDDRVFGRNPSAPPGLKCPKPVRIPYTIKLGGYQPVAPPGYDEKKLVVPVGLHSAAWTAGSLPTSPSEHPAENPFVASRGSGLVNWGKTETK